MTRADVLVEGALRMDRFDQETADKLIAYVVEDPPDQGCPGCGSERACNIDCPVCEIAARYDQQQEQTQLNDRPNSRRPVPQRRVKGKKKRKSITINVPVGPSGRQSLG